MKKVFRDAIEDPDNPIIDINAAGDTVLSMLIDEEGERKFLTGSLENVFLYVHEMKAFLDGDKGALVCKNPHLSVQSTSGSSVYSIRFKDRSVESMPKQADDVLTALRAAMEDSDYRPLMELYQEITDTQVRRDLINDLLPVLPNLDEKRIEVTEQGWMIDKFYLIDWTASLYVASDSGQTFTRGGGGVTTIDKSKEFVELRPETTPKRTRIKMGDEEHVLGEKEMTFLSKAQWVLKRGEYHPDKPFWVFNENYRKKYLRGEK